MNRFISYFLVFFCIAYQAWGQLPGCDNPSVSTSNTCKGDYTPGGTITVTCPSGSGYRYAIVKTDNANDPRLESELGSSNSKTVNEFGVYHIRIKDSNGNARTFSYNLQPELPAVNATFGTRYDICSHKIELTPHLFSPVSGSFLSREESAKYINKLKIILTDEVTGAVLYNGVYNGNPFSVEPTKNTVKRTFTSACGAESVRTGYSLNYNEPTVKTNSLSTSCPPSEKVKILVNTNFSSQKIELFKKGNGTPIKTYNYNPNTYPRGIITYFPDLEIGDYYTVVTDECGGTHRADVPSPKAVGGTELKATPYYSYGENISTNPSTFLGATTEEGTVRIVVDVPQYIPNKEGATLEIIDGPSNIGTKGHYVTYENKWGFNNMVPGLYRVRVLGPCGDIIETDLEVSVEKDPNAPKGYRLKVDGEDGYISPLKQSVTSYTTRVDCEGANGDIFSNITIKGNGNVDYAEVELLRYTENMDIYSPNLTIVQKNSSGQFFNVPRGEYITRMKVVPTSSNGGVPYYVKGSRITIKKNTNTSPPAIKIVTHSCDGFGYISFNVSGMAPYNVKLFNGDRSRNLLHWDNLTKPENRGTITREDFSSNSRFILEISDNCGNTYVSNYSRSQFTELPSELFVTTQQPQCVAEGTNNPYSLEAVDIPFATYAWYKVDENTNIRTLISNQRILNFVNFKPANNGIYEVEVTITDYENPPRFSCSKRQRKRIYANLCGKPIANYQISGTAYRSTRIGVVDGYPINYADNRRLWVLAVNPSINKVITQKEVGLRSTGAFLFEGLSSNTDYQLVLTIEPFSYDGTPTLANEWHYAGERINGTLDTSNNGDGKLLVRLNTSNISNADFGIWTKICNKLPISNGQIYLPKVGITSLSNRDMGGEGSEDWLNKRIGAILVLESKKNGFVLNRVNNPRTDIANPVEGMLVYDISNNCLSLYANGKWECLEQDCIDNN